MTEIGNKVKKSCDVLAKTLSEVASCIEPGVNGLKLDRIAEEYIRDNKAKPAFKGFEGYEYTLCSSINSQVVHGIPSKTVLKEGDIISLDCGVILDGAYSDSAFTFTVGKVKKETYDIVKTTYESLIYGTEKVKNGSRVGDYGNFVQEYCKERGYTVVKELVGHGIGKSLHETPEVPNYGSKGKGKKFKTGMIIALEPMVNQGKENITTAKDGWTIETADKKLSAHFEHIVYVKDNGCEILTDFSHIINIIKTKEWLSSHPLNKTEL